MKPILTASETLNHEYCASVVRIGELFPIENSDFLCYTFINGKTIVIRKDEVNEGDLMFYAENETVLNEDFLGENNLYEEHEFDRNSNAHEVGPLLTKRDSLATQIAGASTDDVENLQKQLDEVNALIKSKTGFFTKQSRVKMIVLRKKPSMGFLFHQETMAKWKPAVADINLEDYVGLDFDTVDGELFIKVYVPKTNTPKEPGSRSREKKRERSIQRFDKMIPGQFVHHYDTQPLGKNMFRIEPNSSVTISVKVHGTSGIFSNIKVKAPDDLNIPIKFLSKIINKLYHKYVPFKWQKTKEVYDNIYSSRSVIKNQYINQGVSSGFYKTDIWGEYNELLKNFIPQGMTVYGEIFGYLTGTTTLIQKDYDYGCAEGTNKFMPYRITTEQSDGTKWEWEVEEVLEWTQLLMKQHPEIADRIFPIDILYHGTLGNLYPQADPANHWHETVLELMANEKRWLMEKRETWCKNKVPREGIVLRIDHDPIKEAFKLKTNAFALKERDQIDAGEVDMEMQENENY